MRHRAQVDGPAAPREGPQQALALVRIEDRPGVDEPEGGEAGREALQGGQREERVLHHPDPGRKEEEDGLGRKAKALGEWIRWPVFERDALGNHDYFGGEVGEGAGDPRAHGVVEDGHRGSALQNAAHRLGPVGIEEVVIAVGARDRHEQRHLALPGQPQGQGSHAEGVEGVNERGSVGLDFALHPSVRNDGAVPNLKIGAQLPEAARDPVDGDGVAANRGEIEGR